MSRRQQLTTSRRWVIKIGSALLTGDGTGLNQPGLDDWVAQMTALVEQGVEVVLVSSGAVAEGMCRLGWSRRPSELHHLQAAAAVGQMGLIQAYESRFARANLHTAQILLTHDDLTSRKRYLNARSAVRSLLQLGVIPVINENDTVVTDEIRFGDNDTLAALVANLVEADSLIILTDQQGLYDCDPRHHPDAKLIDEVLVHEASLDAMATDSAGALGRGGMKTKLRAARLAARSGTSTVIASGREARILTRLRAGEEALGSLLYAEQAPLAARKQWLAGHLQMRGRLELDEGAVRVLCHSGRSLLAVGVRGVSGDFARGEMVACVDAEGREIARGLVNYNADEVRRIMGQPSEAIESILGYIDEPELIHRDNMVLV
ncbi:glutamate 5-kinase [Thiohalophilus thiocyanatoxydans]|uniref:Glutamate 5-kinase n=1 Tax=Thiohalophilus thiocyanatoxydans TaxID=381308 RepID=A0A4V3H3D3_9GAMM|nr:glutamate 5-kinase [Thiohalophilus thiocyanatoxydans]TDX97933.1 glutamate 5-kinase [Thiohalophilus thiocyanatoxydans]